MQKTVAAILQRSGQVKVPFGATLALVLGEGGYRLAESLLPEQETLTGRWRATHADGEPIAPGDMLSSEEAERAVRFLLGLEPVRADNPLASQRLGEGMK